jgi:hypothetical protein
MTEGVRVGITSQIQNVFFLTTANAKTFKAQLSLYAPFSLTLQKKKKFAFCPQSVSVYFL